MKINRVESGSRRTHRFARVGAVTLTAAVLTAVSACSGGGGDGTDGTKSSGSASTSEPSEDIVVVAGDFSDPFFNAMKQGVDDAAERYGVNVQWKASNIEGSALAQSLDSSLASKPDGLVVGNWFPSSENDAIAEAVDSGIPVVDMNAADPDWQSQDLLAFVGMDNYQAGVEAADLFDEKGKTTGLCVNHIPGSPLTDQRCAGFADEMKKKGGTTEVLNIPNKDATNPAAVTQAIKGYLLTHKDIDAVFTLGTPQAVNAVDAVSQLGGDVAVGTTDLSTQVLADVKAGTILFAVDQQPYLQGYYSVAILVDHLRYNLNLVGQVSTGPKAVTTANVDDYIAVNDKHKGILGAG
jgi:simple sugar transport system substrate-binding protein